MKHYSRWRAGRDATSSFASEAAQWVQHGSSLGTLDMAKRLPDTALAGNILVFVIVQGESNQAPAADCRRQLRRAGAGVGLVGLSTAKARLASKRVDVTCPGGPGFQAPGDKGGASGELAV